MTNKQTLQSKATGLSSESLADNERTITTIFQQYHEELKRFLISRMDSMEDVDEVIQEVFLRIVRSSTREDLRNPRAFIYTVARNLLTDRIRRQYVRASDRHVSINKLEPVCSAPLPEAIMQSKEALEIIRGILKQIKPKARRAFVLHRFKGLTYDNIAAEMGISSSMVKHHIRSVLTLCRESLRGI